MTSNQPEGHRATEVEPLVREGTALRDLGRLDEAEGAFRKALEQAPGHAPAHYAIAELFRVPVPIFPSELADPDKGTTLGIGSPGRELVSDLARMRARHVVGLRIP